MMWLLLFIVIAGYLIAMHKEIIMYFKLLWEKIKEMKFEYTVTKEGGEAEIMQAMSWKKLFKKLLMKYPQNSVDGVPTLIRKDTYK